MLVICKYYTIFYKGLEHLCTLVSAGHVMNTPTDSQGCLYCGTLPLTEGPVPNKWRASQ